MKTFNTRPRMNRKGQEALEKSGGCDVNNAATLPRRCHDVLHPHPTTRRRLASTKNVSSSYRCRGEDELYATDSCALPPRATTRAGAAKTLGPSNRARCASLHRRETACSPFLSGTLSVSEIA